MKLKDLLLLAVLTAAVLVVHGYHPYSVDASIYIAGVKKMLHPALYPGDTELVVVHGKFSFFTRLLASVCRGSGLGVDMVLFLSYVSLTMASLIAALRLGTRMFASRYQGWMATLLLASSFTIPVAATSLLLIDPYISARSFSTPFSMFAILSGTNRSWKSAAAWLVATALLHPLMAVYLFAFLAIFALLECFDERKALVLCAGGAGTCAVLYLLTRSSNVTASYQEAALSRTYYFLSLWRWYELLGLLLPLLLMGVTWKRSAKDALIGRLALTCLLLGSTCLICSICFVHPGGSYFLMRLQLLRGFHSVYTLGILMLGGWMGRTFSHRLAPVPWILFAVTAAGLFLAQRDTYRSYPDIEIPGQLPGNAWESAFLWIRSNTPPGSVFAAEPQWLDSEQDDTPGFRAMAERSILTDKKDEGIASLFPSISDEWYRRRAIERGLDTIEDAERVSRLEPYGVSLILLGPTASTALPCIYQNDVVKICELKRRQE